MRLVNVEDLKILIFQRLNILEIIQEDLGDVEWKQSGENWWTFSPFRDDGEKPSFSVSEKLQIFKDFGGDLAGDLISWAKFFHGLDFIESLIYLAQRAKIDLTPFTKDLSPQEAQEDRYSFIIEAVARACNQQLMGNSELLQFYKQDTGFSDDDILAYGVGYSPGVDFVTRTAYQSTANVTAQEVEALELTRGDMFNNSLVYPIRDSTGATRLFYTKPFNVPPGATYKYLGMRKDHPLFSDGLLFGLNVAKKNLRKNKFRLILCEGFKQAIATKGVATMGTSISNNQIVAIKNSNVKEVVVCMDGDHAGTTASMNIAQSVHKWSGVLLRIIRTPSNTQIDELIRDDGIEVLDDLTEEAELPIEYYIKSRYNLDALDVDINKKHQILYDVQEFLKTLPPVELELTSDYLADLLGLSRNSIRGWAQEICVANTNLHNVEAERTILKFSILEPFSISRAISLGIDKEAFTVTSHQLIWQSICYSFDRFDKSSGPQTVADACALISDDDYSSLVYRLASTEVKYDLDAACELVYDLWKRRQIIDQGKKLQTSAYDMKSSIADVVVAHRRQLVSMADRTAERPHTPQELAQHALKMLEERSKKGNIIVGQDFSSCGMALCLTLGGLQSGHMLVVGGPTSAGKSLLGLNMVKPLAIDQGIPWLWINQEMSEDEIIFRLVSIDSGVSNTAIQAGKFKTQEDMDKVRESFRKIHNSQLFMHKPRLGTADEIFHIIDDYRNRYGITGVVWDYIQKVKPAPDQRGHSREQIIGDASKMMVDDVAGSMGIVSIALSQQNRDKDAKRSLEGVGGSYQISQDADDMILIERLNKQEMKSEKEKHAGANRVVIVTKRRGGPANLQFNVRLELDSPDNLRFNELTNHHDWMMIMQRAA